jgi:hypothetical protein
MKIRHLQIASALAATCVLSCSSRRDGADDAPWRPATSAQAQEAQDQFRKFVDGLASVSSLTVVGERSVKRVEYYYVSVFLEVRLKAELRFGHDVTIRSTQEMEARVGKPDWSREEELTDFLRLAVLGGGLHRAGDAVTVEARAVFDDLEPGYRFRLIDGVQASGQGSSHAEIH